MIDIVLLRIMKYQKEYNQLCDSIPTGTLDTKTKAILDDYGKYFEKFPTHKKIDLQVFLPRFKQWHSTMDDEVLSAYIGILKNTIPDADEETKNGIITDLYEADAAMKIANLCEDYSSGDLATPLPDLISTVLDNYKLNIGAKAGSWNDTDIGELLQEDLNNEGINWRLKCLRESMRPLRGGDFGIIAGRPDKGKTTFLASEVTYMANQLEDTRNILWLNNEGLSGRIVKRLYQAALGVTITEAVELNQQHKLKDMYKAAIGRLDRIRVFDIHGMHIGQVEAIIEQNNPGVILYDMIDNIRGFNHAARTDQALEQMYQWARERSVKYDAVGLATSQISADGDGLQFPLDHMLKDSKTGKQGACDFILMIGAVHDDNLKYCRYLSLPKNKLNRDGSAGDPKAEVQFKPAIARYEDVEYGN